MRVAHSGGWHAAAAAAARERSTSTDFHTSCTKIAGTRSRGSRPCSLKYALKRSMCDAALTSSPVRRANRQTRALAQAQVCVFAKRRRVAGRCDGDVRAFQRAEAAARVLSCVVCCWGKAASEKHQGVRQTWAAAFEIEREKAGEAFRARRDFIGCWDHGVCGGCVRAAASGGGKTAQPHAAVTASEDARTHSHAHTNTCAQPSTGSCVITLCPASSLTTRHSFSVSSRFPIRCAKLCRVRACAPCVCMCVHVRVRVGCVRACMRACLVRARVHECMRVRARVSCICA